MSYPRQRLRRTRRTEGLRSMVRETRLPISSLAMPVFVGAADTEPVEVPAMPGIWRWPVDRVGEEAEELHTAGVAAAVLFGVPGAKDAEGSGAYEADGVVQRAIRLFKEARPELTVITDVCLCEYTDHGHCGVVREGTVDNDETLGLLARTAVSHALAGADVVAPSDMMDGRVGAIRDALDEAGFPELPILAYSAKYASAFYGPFREAASSTPAFGDRRGYQMDPSNVLEAVREARLDVEEGADLIMVKPALPSLDVIARVKAETQMPVAAYHVSGEYAMLKAAAERGWIDERQAALEALIAIRRAGADLIVTYYAKDAARWLR